MTYNEGGKLVVDEILRKSRLNDYDIYKDEFCTSNSSKVIKNSTSSSVSSIYSIIAVVARIFSLKTRKKKTKKKPAYRKRRRGKKLALALSYLKLSITADQDNEKCYLHLDEKLVDS